MLNPDKDLFIVTYSLTIEAADYKIKKILPFDKPRITAFLNNAFYPDDPELKAMNVTEIVEYHNEHIVGVIDQGYSYAAVGQDGNTAGVLLMGPGFINRFSTKDLTKIMEEHPVGYFRKVSTQVTLYKSYSQNIIFHFFFFF